MSENSYKRSLEGDIMRSVDFLDKIENNQRFATEVYRTLCNNKFFNEERNVIWTGSWRYVGGFVSGISNPGSSDYMDFYCSGNEGRLNEEVVGMLKELGWIRVDDEFVSKEVNEE
jgi:hypothetical protein